MHLVIATKQLTLMDAVLAMDLVPMVAMAHEQLEQEAESAHEYYGALRWDLGFCMDSVAPFKGDWRKRGRIWERKAELPTIDLAKGTIQFCHFTSDPRD